MCFFFFKQKTAYEMRISDWSSDVCSSDLCAVRASPVAYVAEVIGGAGRQTFCKRNVHDRADFLVGTISDLARNLSFEPIRRIFRNDVDRAACGVATDQGSLRTAKHFQSFQILQLRQTLRRTRNVDAIDKMGGVPCRDRGWQFV